MNCGCPKRVPESVDSARAGYIMMHTLELKEDVGGGGGLYREPVISPPLKGEKFAHPT